MSYYSKIYTIFQRDVGNEKRFVIPLINKQYEIQALSLMKKIRVEEKIDGSNSSVTYLKNERGEFINFYSRKNNIKDKDIMYIKETIQKTVDFDKIREWYKIKYLNDSDSIIIQPDITIKIVGETFGSKIQATNYLPKGERRFIVFDIKVNNTWLSPKDRDTLCRVLGLQFVPTLCILENFPTFEEAHYLLFKKYPKSVVAIENGNDMFLEGFILRPQYSLQLSREKRILGKIKRRDFE